MCLGLILMALSSVYRVPLKNLSLFNFQALDSKFVLALESRTKSFGAQGLIRPYFYVLNGCCGRSLVYCSCER